MVIAECTTHTAQCYKRASFANADNMSDGNEDDSKDNINYPKCDNKTPKCVHNGNRLCDGDAKALYSKYT